MTTYIYSAVNSKGKTVKGTVDAESRELAIQNIRQKSLTPVKVTEQGVLNKDIDLSFMSKVSVRDMAVFCRQLASLLKAGVTIVDALAMLSDSTENKGLAGAVGKLGSTIKKGDTLGVAMRDFPQYFDAMLISLVDAGEASGSLENSLNRMADQYEKSSKLQATIKKALIYPIIVLVVAVVVLVVMLYWIVPTFMKMFDGLDLEMPKLTMVVVDISNFVQAHILLLLLIVIALVVAITVFKKSKQGRRFFSYVATKLPIISVYTMKTNSARFAQTLSTLIACGLPLTDALEITSHTLSNILFQEAVLNARDQVTKGVPLSEPLKLCGLFPPMVCHMVRIGEDTGDLEGMLDKLAEYYNDEVEQATQNLVAGLEPIVILFLTGLVGIIVAAVMGPMVKLYTGLDTGL